MSTNQMYCTQCGHDPLLQADNDRRNQEEINKLRAQVEQLRESLAELIEQVDRSMHGETGLHTWKCPAPDHGKCSCNAEAAMDYARKVLEGAK